MNIGALLGAVIFGIMTMYTIFLYTQYLKTGSSFLGFKTTNYIVGICFFSTAFLLALVSI